MASKTEEKSAVGRNPPRFIACEQFPFSENWRAPAGGSPAPPPTIETSLLIDLPWFRSRKTTAAGAAFCRVVLSHW